MSVTSPTPEWFTLSTRNRQARPVFCPTLANREEPGLQCDILNKTIHKINGHAVEKSCIFGLTGLHEKLSSRFKF